MPVDRWPIEKARAAAWRMWEEAVREERRPTKTRGLTGLEICDRYVQYCAVYYSDRGAKNENLAIRMFREMFGGREVCELSHADMIALRNAHIASGICRRTVNERMTATRRMIAWALDEALIPATVRAELSQVAPLKRGRSAAPETAPVRSARDEDIDALEGTVSESLLDMVRVERLTGMRPGEICAMRWEDIEERESGPWIYRPADHKNKWRGQPRVVLIGPRARAILARHRGEGRHCFSPRRSVEEWLARIRAARRTPVQPSQIDRSKPEATRKPGEEWTPGAYARALKRAFASLHRPGFAPNQLRHSFATEVRRQFGLTACRAVLGHSGGERVTDIYSFEAIEDEIIATAKKAVEILG